MNRPVFCVLTLERRFANGNTEELVFERGVNLLVGRPNTGKTKWLQTLDFLLGDTGENPFEGADETGLTEKYDAAASRLLINNEEARIERRWREPGVKSKIFVDGTGMTARELQNWLMERLGIPLLHFPRGNPMSGQTWPELSFRMLLRHMYRQQRFWGTLADQQFEGEQHACLLHFLGLAERIYTKDYGRLMVLKMKADKLRSRRDQYGETLNHLARDVLAEPSITVDVTPASITVALQHLTKEINELSRRRTEVLTKGSEAAMAPSDRSHLAVLGERRADTLVRLEEDRRRLKMTEERLQDMRRYRDNLANELDRLARAKDAAAVMADLRITHCPACDQPVADRTEESKQCFLCHQELSDQPVVEELGSMRLQFESDRLAGELKEADELLGLLDRERKKYIEQITIGEDDLRSMDRELEPARQAVSALVQEEVSAIDVALGRASERERQIHRVAAAVELGADLDHQISLIGRQMAPIQERVDQLLQTIDFDAAAELLENGMNEYLNALNLHRRGVWRHSPVRVDVSRSSFTFRVGQRRWNAVLGGTDQLYFLMAYHYGLLTLSNNPDCHYPGIAIIDVPPEFSGEAVKDKENFIVQPFIELLGRDEYNGAQLIITGASFSGLEGAHFQRLTYVHVA